MPSGADPRVRRGHMCNAFILRRPLTPGDRFCSAAAAISAVGQSTNVFWLTIRRDVLCEPRRWSEAAHENAAARI